MDSNNTVQNQANTTQNKKVSIPINLFVSEINSGIESKTPLVVYSSQEVVKNQPMLVTSELSSRQSEVEVLANLPIQKEVAINTIRFSYNPALDESEEIRSEIAELFNINVPKSRKIYGDAGVGVITDLNITNKAQVIRMSNWFSEICRSVQMGMYGNNYPEYNIDPNKSGEAITEVEKIKLLIKKGINAFPISTMGSQEEANALIKDYIQMILLDLVIGQKSRDGMTYFLAKTASFAQTPTGEKTAKIKYDLIAGIGSYDVFSTTLLPNEYNLNDRIVDRNALITVLINEYPAYTKNILSPLLSVTNRYKECISKIIYNNMNKETAAQLEGIIFNNIDQICATVKELPENENKVELAYTTAKLNLTIARKEDTINLKYPINPRDVEEPTEKVEEDDRIRITTSDDEVKLRANGFASAALVGSVVSIICGIGVGIAYIILRF